MKIWQIWVSRAQSYIFSAVVYWELKFEFLDHFFILFRMAHLDVLKTALLLRYIGLNAKMPVFSNAFLVVFIYFLEYNEENSNKFHCTL
jgi:hypothetical protein